jgi:peptidoglycan/xylan/chitin deacetylase (PgdA/CDA1 family)
MVLLTFDDAVTKLLYETYYKRLLDLENPNGCKIGITFFASHEYCDYSLLHDLYSRRHEIAIHSISHKPDQEYWKNGGINIWKDEMVGMRTMVEKFAKIPRRDLKGIRVPFLQTGGDTQFKMMEQEGFEWDCSMPTRTYTDPGMWPYSLKYKSTMDCQIGPCPTESYPGVWVIPMLDLFTKDETPCAMLDTCLVTHANETYDLLMDNFKRSYNGNRAPFGLYVHAAWFIQGTHSGHWDGYLQFIREIIQKKDVFFVTASQALDWTRNPTKLAEIANLQSWNSCRPKTSRCQSKTCKLHKDDPISGGERYMTGCFDGGICPSCYPWVGKPEGVC